MEQVKTAILETLTGLSPYQLDNAFDAFDKYQVGEDFLKSKLDEKPTPYTKEGWEELFIEIFKEGVVSHFEGKESIFYDVFDFIAVPNTLSLAVAYRPIAKVCNSIAVVKGLLDKAANLPDYFNVECEILDTESDLKGVGLTVKVNPRRIQWRDHSLATRSLEWEQRGWEEYFAQDSKYIDTNAFWELNLEIAKAFKNRIFWDKRKLT